MPVTRLNDLLVTALGIDEKYNIPTLHITELTQASFANSWSVVMAI